MPKTFIEQRVELRKEFDQFCIKIPATYYAGEDRLGIDGATTEEIADWWIEKLSAQDKIWEEKIEEIIKIIGETRADPNYAESLRQDILDNIKLSIINQEIQ